jgi:norsolorinic acid ketoreductase
MAKQAIDPLQRDHTTTYLDLVAVNSVINDFHGPSISATEADFVEHIKVNTIGPVLLFSAALPLVEKSSKPKLFDVSSELGYKGRLAPAVGSNWIPYGVMCRKSKIDNLGQKKAYVSRQ